ncbi:hypothetical protein Tco_0918869 [Tanacetum coccineum]
MAACKPRQPMTVTNEEGGKKKKAPPAGRVMKIRKGRSSYQLVDKEEEEEDQLKPEPQVEDEEYDLQRVTQDATTEPFAQPQDDTFTNVVRDTSSPEDSINYAKNVTEMEQTNSDTRTEILKIEEEPCEEVSNTVALEERTVKLDEGQARSDPGKTPEYRPPPEHVFMEEDQAGSNPGQSHVS